jgi:hypothetical protein
MTVRLIVAFAFLLGVGGFGLAGSLAGLEIVDAVNAKLPKEEKFAPLGWYFAKTQRLNREYRRLYPSGRLLWRQGICSAAMLLCLLVAAGLMDGVGTALFLGVPGGLILWFTFFRKVGAS